MSAKTNFELMARYNQWMNEKIYEAASGFSEIEIREDQGAFFKSILGTLNHLLVTDVLWLKRFAQHPKAYESLRFLKNLASPASLDEILYDDLGKLWKVRREFDDAIMRWSKEMPARFTKLFTRSVVIISRRRRWLSSTDGCCSRSAVGK